jgi:uncharacterized protein YuzE
MSPGSHWLRSDCHRWRYAIKQVAPIIKEEANEIVVITVYTFYFWARRAMKITYDPEIDALYIRFLEGKQECRSVHLSEEVALNIGAGEKLVGIEILDAQAILGPGKTPAVVLEGLESAAPSLVVQEEPPKEFDA